MKKFLSLILVFCVIFSFSGCASLKGNVPFQYQPSLVASNKKIDKVVGLNMFIDKRPEKDAKYTKSILDINEKVTSKILQDFKESDIFTEIHYPARPDDDIVINGILDRFKWKMYAKPICYIPYVGLLAMIVGVNVETAYGVAGITIEVKDNKTGSTLATISKELEVENSYSAYNFKAGEAGAELSEAFREVVKQIKRDLVTTIY